MNAATGMHALLGYDAAEAQKQSKPLSNFPVVMDIGRLTNPHLLLCGMSGSGKTYTLRALINAMLKSAGHKPPRIHIIDVHGDIDIEGASEVVFSETQPYGLNPLVVNPDRDSGGIRKRIQTTIEIIESTLGALGNKQEAALRNLMYDTYRRFGFDADDPATWDLEANAGARLIDESQNRLYIDVPFEEKELAKNMGARFDGTVKSWYVPIEAYKGEMLQWPQKTRGKVHPTLLDVLSEARQVLHACFFGNASERSMRALGAANSAARALRLKQIKVMRGGGVSQADEQDLAELERAKEKAIEAYSEYVNTMKTGKELESLMRYDSVDVLKSVVDRLENLLGYGIFKEKAPPFDPNKAIWRYNISNLGSTERKLFGLFKMQELFEETRLMGEQSTLTNIIVADEAHIYSDKKETNPMNSIAKESRKFGLALWCASQSPTHFPEDFLSGVATKIILGIDEMFWKKTEQMMRIPMQFHEKLQRQKIILAQLKTKGDSSNKWIFVRLPQAN